MGRVSRASIFPVMTPSPVVLLSIERAGGTALPVAKVTLKPQPRLVFSMP